MKTSLLNYTRNVKCILFLAFFGISVLGWGQINNTAPILLDNYDGVGDLTYTPNGTSQWSINGGIYVAGTNASTTPEHSCASYDLTNSIPTWSLTKTNQNVWIGYFKILRTTSGWGTSNYGCGVVLASNNVDFANSSANGYALVIENGSPDKVTLVKFSAGIKDGATNLPINSTSIASVAVDPGTTGFNYMVELLNDGKWKISYKTGAQLSDANAIIKGSYDGGNVTSASADETYTGSTYKHTGWVFSHSSGNTTTDKANFDNLGAAQAATGLTPPTLTAAVGATVDAAFNVTFTDDATWRAAITSIKVGATTLTAGYSVSAGQITFTPSTSTPSNLLQTAASPTITVVATGYTDATVTQAIGAGAATKLAIVTQPTAPATNGGALATQPVVRIQDQYSNTTTSTASVTATVGAGTWTLGGTASVNGVAGTVTYSGLTATSSAAVTGATISFTSSGLTGVTSDAFDILAPVPFIFVGTITGFGNQEINTSSAEITYNVEGINLTDDIIITPPIGFLISITSGSGYTSSQITLTQSGGTVASTPIYVVFNPTIVQAYAGNITHESTGAFMQNIACSGTGTAPVPTLPHYDGINYTIGQGLQTQTDWTILNTGDDLLIASGNLSYPGLVDSMGNKVTFSGAGIDGAKLFTQQTTGTVYYSFILDVTSLGSLDASGGYFSGFTEGTSNNFGATIWTRLNGADYNIGINPRTTVANTTWSNAQTINNTLFIVVSYQIVDGAANDVVKLWINPTPGIAEPMATLTATNAGTDLANVNRILIRQDSDTETPYIEMDELRIGTSWEDVTPAAPPTITSFTPTNVCEGASADVVITGTNYTGTTAVKFNDVDAISFTVDNAGQITAATPASVSTGKISVTTPGGTIQSAGDFTVNTVPAAVTVNDAGTFCGSTTLTASGGTGGTIYFQGTTSGGTSTATVSSSEIITASGTYYFRAQSAEGCWGAEGSAVVTINPLPAAAGTITGTASVMAGTPGVQYTVPAIAGATSYTWAYSGSNATINGTGNTITINFASNATGGNLTVKGINACGDGVASTSYAIAITPPKITFYFRGPTWMDNNPHNPQIWGPYNGWAVPPAMTYGTVPGWWSVTVDVADAFASIEYQSRFAQGGTTKYQKATENFGANATFTTTTGEIWIDASNDASFTWSGNDFYLLAGKITETRPQLEWANLQSPASGSIMFGGTYDVYAQVKEPGLTPGAPQGADISAWIGYSTSDTNPNTWTNWVSATWNNAVTGNNDEYTANFSSSLPAGTYYYASRFKLGQLNYVYGGYNAGGGGFWDGTTNVNGILEVQAISLYGTATSNQDKDMYSTDGNFFSLTVELVDGVAEFRQNHSGAINWSSNAFPSGTGTQDGSDIPITAGTYLVTFYKSSGAYTFTNVNCTSTITRTWDGTQWTNDADINDHSVPGFDSKAIFNGDYTTTISGLSACECQINADKTVTVADNTYFTVSKSIVNNGNLVVESQGNVIQYETTNTNTGTGYKVKKTTSTAMDYDYIYWSSPVSNANIANVFSDNPSYRYQFVTDNFVDLYSGTSYPQTAGAIGDGYDDNGNDWAAASGTMSSGKGYIVMAKGSEMPINAANLAAMEINAAQNVEFTGGVFNSGNLSITALQDGTTDQDTYNNNLNFIGNPYPSAISADRFINTNTAVLEGTLYFWTHKTAVAANAGPNAYDFNNADFATYTLSGGVASANGGTIPTGNIASCQGFMASVKEEATGNIVFNNLMRLAENNNNFYRQALPVEKDRLWLNMTGNDDLYRQILVAFLPEASIGFDQMYDGLRMYDETTEDFYSVLNDQKYAIQAYPAFDVNYEIPLGIQIKQAGTYSIDLDGMEGILEGQDVYLEDTENEVIHNLKSSAYTFNTSAGNFDERFILRFTNSALGNEETTLSQVKVYPNPSTGVFYINYVGGEKLTYTVYDLTGKKVLMGTGTVMDLSTLNSGIYTAQISNAASVKSVKLIRE